MSLAKDLEIYKAADALLILALQVQAQVPRAYRVAVGQRISNECADILLTVARANVARGPSREAQIGKLLEHLEAATILQPLERGIDFVGQVIKPWHRTTRKRTMASALQRLATMPAADTFTAGNSYLGLVRQASHSHQHQAALANVLRKRGHAVAGDLTKVFRRAN